jgi:hypothetical protein
MRHVLFATTVLIAPLSAHGQWCTAPGPAAAVGYNTQTFGGVAPGKNWFACSGDAATQNADGSITIPGGTCNRYNGQLTTGDQQFGGGGYFEATLSFKNHPAGWSKSVDGWPAFSRRASRMLRPPCLEAIRVALIVSDEPFRELARRGVFSVPQRDAGLRDNALVVSRE